MNHTSYNSLFNRIFDATNINHQQSSPLELMKKAQQQQLMSQFLVKQPNTFIIPPSFVPFGHNSHNQMFSSGSSALLNHSPQAAAALHKQKLGMV